MCDIDFPYVERSHRRPPAAAARGRPRRRPSAVKLQEAYTKAKKYDDFRTMLDKQKDIDAVVIATPDHLHAIAAYTAMKARQARLRAEAAHVHRCRRRGCSPRTARETKVVTQMGNQGHSMEGTRRINELIAAGVIGPIREVHMWTDRPAALLGAGHSASRHAASRRPTTPPDPSVPPRLEHAHGGQRRAQGDGRRIRRRVPPGVRLGSLPRTHHARDRRITRPITRSAGAASSTSASAPSATWARTSSTSRSGRSGSTIRRASSRRRTPWGGGEKDPAHVSARDARELRVRRARRPDRRCALTWYDGGLLPVLAADIPLPRRGRRRRVRRRQGLS